VSRRKRKIRTKNKLNNKDKNSTTDSVNKEKLLNQLDSLTSDAKKRKESVKIDSSSNRNYYIFGGTVIIAIVIGFVALSPAIGPGGIIGNGNGPQLATYANTCIKSTDTVDIHIHAQLRINFNGLNQPVPPDTGIKSGCHSPIHTHSGEARGTLHIESSSAYNLPPATIGDFFDIWEESLTEFRVWDFSGTVNMTANGFTVPPPFGELVLVEGHNIVIDITS
jgi:hypothetical protein